MNISEFPLWVILGAGIVALTGVALVFALIYEVVRPKPRKRIRIGDTTVTLWVRERRMPGSAGALVVPVATDLKMVAGIAKWARDAGADRLQHEADAAAPLAPGEAFVGSGGRYRFKVGALAVVMDDAKRTSPEWIRDAVATALRAAREKDARSAIVADFTEDLLRQPNWITAEQRRETCGPIARAILDGIVAGGGTLDEVRIWVWRGGNEDIYAALFDERTGRATSRPVTRATTA
jgi:hypothetical protein